MKRYRFTIFIGLLLLLWLAFGSQILHQVGILLAPIDAAPSLPGRLLYTQGFEGVWQVDMETGEVSQWWLPPEGGFVTGIAASPDGSQLALAYAPPNEEGFQVGTTDLYLSPSDTPDPQPLFVREERNESYRNPFWSPDGQQLYFSHVTLVRNDEGETTAVRLNSERVDLDTNETQVMVENAEQYVLSPDAGLAAYLQFDPVSYGESIWLSASDGSNAQEVLPVGAFSDINNVRFTPDGSALVFGGSGDFLGDPERLAVDGVAQAHGLPWHIWQIDLDGGNMRQLTETTLDGPWIAWQPDGSAMALIAAEGVFLRHEGSVYRLATTSTEGEITWTR